MTRKSTTPPSFAARLRQLRATAGLSQRQLADKSGVPLSTIQKIERSAYEPNWSLALALARGLGVTVARFEE